MDYGQIQKKKQLLEQKKESIPRETLEQMEAEFEAQFTYDSLSLSDSSLSLEEVKAILSRTRKKESAETE